MDYKGLYIIFTGTSMQSIGGMQMYISGFSDFLIEKGYRVAVFFAGDSWGKCIIPNLQKFVCGGNELLLFEPVMFTSEELDDIYEACLRRYDIVPEDYDEIYIESHADVDALWAEFFAMKMGAKHIALLLNEFFDREDKCYKKYIEFFWQMYLEKRLYGKGLISLFSKCGYQQDIVYKAWSREGNPICDVENPIVENIRKADWNIAYVGRGNKEYVPTIIQEMRLFADRHKDKMIQFIFVGDSDCQMEHIEEMLRDADNLFFYPCGNLVPIPKRLFEKADVLIGNSQTAYFCALEGKPVAILSSADYKSSGILGYDCHEKSQPNYREDVCEDLVDVLEDALVTRKYCEKQFDLPIIQYEEVYGRSVDAFKGVDDDTAYYDVLNPRFGNQGDRKESMLSDIRKEINDFDTVLSPSDKLAIFGTGNEGKKCLSWLDEKGIVPVLITDNDRGKWGTNIGNYIIESPDKIPEYEIDEMIICNVNSYKDIIKQVCDEYELDPQKCVTYRSIRFYEMGLKR